MPFEIPSYALIKLLGQGSMAEVWLAEHRINKRKAAIKILLPSNLTDAESEALFLREGEVLAGFRDDNIVAIYDNNRIGALAYIVMEYLSGGTLLERMKRGPISVGEAIGLIAQIAKALAAAHRLRIVHRDLKPSNIMLRDETTPVLTDFGAVRMLERSTIYGKDGGVIGTPIYMSPEQITGKPLDGRSDLYALGVLFYELLTGELPFPGGSVTEIASQHVFAPIPRLPIELAMLQPILERLLAKQADERYATADEFIAALRTCFLHEAELRRQVGFAATSAAWSSQLRALGFVLDAQQKSEVRAAQGDFLRATAPVEAASPIASSTRATASSRWKPVLLVVGLLAVVLIAALLFLKLPASGPLTTLTLQAVVDNPTQADLEKAASILECRLGTLGARRGAVTLEGERLNVSFQASDPAAIGEQLRARGRLIMSLVIGDGGAANDGEILELPLVEDVQAVSRTIDGTSEIVLSLPPSGAAQLEQFTSRHVGRQVALMLDGTVLTVAAIHEPIAGGKLSISGGQATPEAQKKLAEQWSRQLRCGALPFTLRPSGNES